MCGYVAIPSDVAPRGGRGRGNGSGRGRGSRGGGRFTRGGGRKGRGTGSKARKFDTFPDTMLNLAACADTNVETLDVSLEMASPNAIENLSVEGQSPLPGCGGWPDAATSSQ